MKCTVNKEWVHLSRMQYIFCSQVGALKQNIIPSLASLTRWNFWLTGSRILDGVVRSTTPSGIDPTFSFSRLVRIFESLILSKKWVFADFLCRFLWPGIPFGNWGLTCLNSVLFVVDVYCRLILFEVGDVITATFLFFVDFASPVVAVSGRLVLGGISCVMNGCEVRSFVCLTLWTGRARLHCCLTSSVLVTLWMLVIHFWYPALEFDCFASCILQILLSFT